MGSSVLASLHEQHKARQLRIKQAAIKIHDPEPAPIAEPEPIAEPDPEPDKIVKLGLVNTFDIIVNVICTYYNVRKIDILSNRRLRGIAERRHMLAYMLYRMTNFTNSQIAPKMNRDPTTIGYAINKVIDHLDQYQAEIEELEKRILELMSERRSVFKP